MNYLLLVKNKINQQLATGKINYGSAKSVLSAKRVVVTERRFTKATDPYRKIGAKSYWKLHVPADQRPQWVKDEYGLD